MVTLSWIKLSFPGSVDRLTDLCDMTYTVLISSFDTTKQILIKSTGKIKTSLGNVKHSRNKSSVHAFTASRFNRSTVYSLYFILRFSASGEFNIT